MIRVRVRICPEEVAAGGAPVVVLGVGIAVQRRGEAAVEVPEGMHALQRTELPQRCQAFVMAFVGEALLLVAHIGDRSARMKCAW